MPRYLVECYYGCIHEVFGDDINIWIHTLVKQIDLLRVGMAFLVSVTLKQEGRPACVLEEIPSNYFELGRQLYPPCGLKWFCHNGDKESNSAFLGH